MRIRNINKRTPTPPIATQSIFTPPLFSNIQLNDHLNTKHGAIHSDQEERSTPEGRCDRYIVESENVAASQSVAGHFGTRSGIGAREIEPADPD